MSLRIEDAETMESISPTLKNLKFINKDKNVTGNNMGKSIIYTYIRTNNLFLDMLF